MRLHAATAISLLFATIAWAQPLQTFTIQERYGVSHPDQIVYFDMPDGVPDEAVHLRDGDGQAVLFQIMHDGRFAVRSDLPAEASRRWTLHAYAPAKDMEPAVTLESSAEGLTMDNGLLAIRLPHAPEGDDLDPTPAPIQGVRDRDGIWTALGPNFMDRPAERMAVEVLDAGPLVARVRVEYVFTRAHLRSSRPELPEIPAGDGRYAVTVEIQAGQPVILFEEDSEVDVGYGVWFDDGWQPDRARYRGHHATRPEFGREPDGRTYRPGHTRPPMDAEIDLDFTRDEHRWSRASYPYLSHWDPWARDTGYAWQVYDGREGGGERILGIFAGRASRLLVPGLSGVAFDTAMIDGEPAAGLRVRFQRLMPTQFYSTRMRFGWGIFLGRMGVDYRDADEVQAVGRAMNLHSGVNLNTLHGLPGDFADPPAGYGSLYVPAETLEPLKAELRAEKAAGGRRPRYQGIYNASSGFKNMLEFWSDPTEDAAERAAATVTNNATHLLETLVNGHGPYVHQINYFMGASRKAQQLVWLDQLLGSDHLRPETRDALKRAAELYATLLWNDDLAPMMRDAEGRNISGMNWGRHNMSSMYRGTRYGYTLFLFEHPHFRPRVPKVKEAIVRQLHEYVHPDGACNASVHYTGATMVPILNLVLQLQRIGAGDLCATEPRMRRYGEWELQVMTPPEPRFGGLRKIISLGDGATEASPRAGPLGTAFTDADPRLSARLMGAWRDMGEPIDAVFGHALLRIDPALSGMPAKLGDDQFEGYFSVLRHAYDTPDETVAWFVNGNWYSDARHNDAGVFIFYALGAPLSIDWGTQYSQRRTAGGLMHSIVLPETVLPHAWDAADTSFSDPSPAVRWRPVGASALASFAHSAWSTAEFRRHGHSDPDMRWRRTVRLLRSIPGTPILSIEDTVTDTDDEPVVVSTLNLMADGEVRTPVGPVTPPERLDDQRDPDQREHPSAGTAFDLREGINRFGFTGQWGVDWDLFVEAPQGWQATLGNWAHRGHPNREMSQFRQAHGKPFEERQHILRLRGAGPKRTLIVPYRTGARPDPLTIDRDGRRLHLRIGSDTLILSDAGSIHRGVNGERILTAFGAHPLDADDVTLEGGPMELSMDAEKTVLTVHGPAGDRTVGLPPGWSMAPDERHDPLISRTADGLWTIAYRGNGPLRLSLNQPMSGR